MPVVNSVISWIMKQRIHQIEQFIVYPCETQERWLINLLASAANTQWGQQFEYRTIDSITKFKDRVPVQDYDTLKPYITKQLNGEQNVLWPTPPRWFAKSSGTTSDKSKFIPVTPEALEETHFKGGKDLLSIYCNNNPDNGLFKGKLLSMGGSHQINSHSNQSFYGDLSAILIQNLPFWMQMFRTPDMSIAMLDHWEEKIEKIAKATVNENITNISGVPSWTVVLIKYMLEMTGKQNLHDIWPNLELFVHGGVSFVPYKEQFAQFAPGSKLNYLETYNASEGFFGIQDIPGSDDLLLMLDYGIYYEFIPEAYFDSENPITLSLSEVETDKNYALVISTNAGLWRYKIGDTIRFTSISPYRIKISGRTKHFINAFGEELIIDNADYAVDKACQATGAIITDYTAGPVYFSDNEKNGAHEWLLEFERDPNSIETFTNILDEELKNINSDYEAKRSNDLALGKPRVTILPTGTFYNWLKSKNKLGGQNKVPRLSNDRKLLEEITAQLVIT